MGGQLISDMIVGWCGLGNSRGWRLVVTKSDFCLSLSLIQLFFASIVIFWEAVNFKRKKIFW